MKDTTNTSVAARSRLSRVTLLLMLFSESHAASPKIQAPKLGLQDGADDEDPSSASPSIEALQAELASTKARLVKFEECFDINDRGKIIVKDECGPSSWGEDPDDEEVYLSSDEWPSRRGRIRSTERPHRLGRQRSTFPCKNTCRKLGREGRVKPLQCETCCERGKSASYCAYKTSTGPAPVPTPYPTIIGRPFVDSGGSVLQASELAPEYVKVSMDSSALDENKEDLEEEEGSATGNETFGTPAAHLGTLAGDWKRNSFGEHASVASFAAFTIQLMTNGAPLTLVEDSMRAGIDEIRHAKTSFAIASKLAGRTIAPNKLPESHHAFFHDMEGMAVATADEGCVGETLSALDAAADVDLINRVLEGEAEGAKYSGVDKKTLVWIRDELRTIAIEESSHSALAWRTIKWVCSVDVDACDAVQDQVLNKEQLTVAFATRFGRDGTYEGSESLFQLMDKGWEAIIGAGLDGVCVDEADESDSFVVTIASLIAKGITSE
ncbi:hypothetical protein ACHAWF_008239 [Thalassiosira exigua]